MANAQQLAWYASLILVGAVISIAIIDFRTRRIPNLIVFPLTIIGLTLNSIRGIDGFLFGLNGLLSGLGLLFIPYLFRAMGAGDVKLLAGIGSVIGANGSLRVLLITLLIYPFIAFFFVVAQGKLKITIRRFTILFCQVSGILIAPLKLYAQHLRLLDDQTIKSAHTPFGLIMAIGTIVAVFTNFLR